LLAGRNVAPLTEEESRRVANTFLGMDSLVNFKYEPQEETRCRVYREDKETICEIVYGPDIYPGTNVIDPNSSLSMAGAVAHELSHYHRWKDKTELSGGHLVEIDEALTSLDAVQRYHNQLSQHEIRQLVLDAMQRLQMFARKYQE
jgi:hypothetical protein